MLIACTHQLIIGKVRLEYFVMGQLKIEAQRSVIDDFLHCLHVCMRIRQSLVQLAWLLPQHTRDLCC